MKNKFVHLNLHTEYSIIDGIIKIDQIIKKCVEYKMPAVALTDQSNLFALVKFYKNVISAGIKPIIGVDIWLIDNENDNIHYKIILLAQNYIGYKNILKLISHSYINGQHLGIPRISRKWLEELSDGIIILSGGKYGDIGKMLLADEKEKTILILKFWQKVFPNRYYLELHRTENDKEEEYISKAVDLATQYKIPMVATNLVRFITPADFTAHEIRVCINRGNMLNDNNRPKEYTNKQYFRSSKEMYSIFHDIPSALINTIEISKRCNLELHFGKKTWLPIFPTINNIAPEKLFTEKVRLGFNNRKYSIIKINNKNHEYINRLEYEIKIINQMGFASYFLIVADFINWAKNNDIPVGPGRGSGAGSLVAFSLGITDIDPIEHELIFERFLNPERISLPDLDIDFCVDGRDKVISYVINRYGRNKVAQIITYGTMSARAVVRDVGRVLGYTYGYVDSIAKLIPPMGINLEEAFNNEKLLKQKYETEESVKHLIDLAKKLEGIVKNASKHAGGIVIAPSVLTDFVPLYRCDTDNSSILTQLDKDDIETMGLVKFDFLGLKTLTIIDWTIKSINNICKIKKKALLDFTKINMDDSLVYKLLQSGKTNAIFQLESRISKDLIKKFKPNCFNDIVALVAIIRPGVLQSGMLDEIMIRKQKRTNIVYLHPKLEPILKSTYGVAIYQEQVMKIAQSLAGYTLGSADLLRRAMGKKKPNEMFMQRKIFSSGAEKNNINRKLADNIFDYMEKFADYGFNKSHSTAYALLSYQTAWLKTYYPAEFMSSVMSADMDNTDKIFYLIQECNQLKLKIIPPDINISNYKFTVNDDGEIVYGLGAIKGIGEAVVDEILLARQLHGKFDSILSLCERTDIRKVNKRILEILVCAGAFDNFGIKREKLFSNIELMIKTIEQFGKNQHSQQMDLFNHIHSDRYPVINFIDVKEWSIIERLKNEKNVLGFYLQGHPIEYFLPELEQFISIKINQLSLRSNKSVLIAGFINSIKIIYTKKNLDTAIINIEDITGNTDIIIFNKYLEQCRSFLNKDNLIIIEGEIKRDITVTEKYKIIAYEVMTLDQVRAKRARTLIIDITALQCTIKNMKYMRDILSDYLGGNCSIIIYYNNNVLHSKLLLGNKWKIIPNEELLSKLKNYFGNNSIRLLY